MGDLFALLTAVCWSIAVILFDLSSNKLTPLQINIIKNSVGVFGFLSTIKIFSITYPGFSNNELGILFASGLVGVGIADLFFLKSLKIIGSSLSAIVSAIYAPSVFIIAYIYFNEVLTLHTLFGSVLVICGIIISTYNLKRTKLSTKIYIGITYGCLAQILTAISVLSVKPIMLDNPILYVALIRFATGLLFTLMLIVYRSGLKALFDTIKVGYGNYKVLLGAFFGTYLSVILWLAGYKYTLAARAAIYNQLSTILIAILAVFFLGEKLTNKKIIGIIFAFVGAVFISF